MRGDRGCALDDLNLLRQGDRTVVTRNVELPSTLRVERVRFLWGTESALLLLPFLESRGKERKGRRTHFDFNSSDFTSSCSSAYVSAFPQNSQMCLTLTSRVPSFFASSSLLSPTSMYGRCVSSSLVSFVDSARAGRGENERCNPVRRARTARRRGVWRWTRLQGP